MPLICQMFLFLLFKLTSYDHEGSEGTRAAIVLGPRGLRPIYPFV